jgi:hypothetical protein
MDSTADRDNGRVRLGYLADFELAQPVSASTTPLGARALGSTNEDMAMNQAIVPRTACYFDPAMPGWGLVVGAVAVGDGPAVNAGILYVPVAIGVSDFATFSGDGRLYLQDADGLIDRTRVVNNQILCGSVQVLDVYGDGATIRVRIELSAEILRGKSIQFSPSRPWPLIHEATLTRIF